MVREAEEFAEEDKKVKEKIDSHALETYVYNMKNQANDKEKLADKLEENEKEKTETATKEALEWLDDNQNALKEEYGEKLKEVEAVCNLIVTAFSEVWWSLRFWPSSGKSSFMRRHVRVDVDLYRKQFIPSNLNSIRWN
ncbi:luminal binding protein [Tanacetum coccineum]